MRLVVKPKMVRVLKLNRAEVLFIIGGNLLLLYGFITVVTGIIKLLG